MFFYSGNVAKFCKHKDVGTEELFSSEEAITIFFMTDRNRGGRGFVIEYKLSKLRSLIFHFPEIFLKLKLQFLGKNILSGYDILVDRIYEY